MLLPGVASADTCSGSPTGTPRLANGDHFGLTFADNGMSFRLTLGANGLTLRDKGSQTARSAHGR